ncbi:hypothetical protein Dsin_033101, partial [Dipteronia sinensis]
DCMYDHKPFLRSINLEVLNITIPDLAIRVNHPVLNSCLSNESTLLENTPYYSQIETGSLAWHATTLRFCPPTIRLFAGACQSVMNHKVLKWETALELNVARQQSRRN